MVIGLYGEVKSNNGESGCMTGVWSYNDLDALKQRYSGLKQYWDDGTKAALQGSELLQKYEVKHPKYNYSASLAITKPTMVVGTAAIKLTY